MRTRLFQFMTVVLLLCGAGMTISCSKDADENGYVPLTEMLDKESLEYGINIIDHAAEPMQQSVVVVRQLMQALQKLQNAFYASMESK